MVLFSLSCDTDIEGEGKPWDGQEVRKMNSDWDAIRIPTAGNTWWFSFDARAGARYSINMQIGSSNQRPLWAEREGLFLTSAIMTGYTENGVVFASMNPRDEGNFINTPIIYNSPVDQTLYISFTTFGTGYLYFRYQFTY
jgi:hypothetical protein